MKHITRMLIFLLFLSGVFTVSSNMMVISLRLNSALNEQQFNDTVKNSLTMNIIDGPVRIAIYFEANTSIPSYSNALELTNSYSEVQDLFESAGYEVTLLTTDDILDHKLITANYDVFVLINHLPRESIVHLVKEFWLGGGGILSFNSAISYLFYYGLFVPELEGDDHNPGYWTYLSVEYMNVTVHHPITKEYKINDAVYERPEYWVVYAVSSWYSSAETGAINLLTNFTQSNYGYAVAVDSTYRGGRVVQLPGDGNSITADFESIIINAAEWLVPKPKSRIAYDLSHQPRLCVDSWDIEFATAYTSENSFTQLRNIYVNRSYTFDKFYPSASGNFTSERLANYDLVIICFPDLNITDTERNAIEEWINAGGSLILLGDRPAIGYGNLAIDFLLDDFSMKLSADNIEDVTTASVSGEHPTLEGCTTLSISFRNYITITDPSAQAIWDDAGTPVVAAQVYNLGRVILFSDMNILDNGRLKLSDNRHFAINVANWLSSTTAEILLFTTSHYNPTIYRSPVANALNELNLDFHLTSTAKYLELGLEEKDWELVLVDEASYDVPLAYDVITDYLDTTDGRIIMSAFNIDEHPDDPVWQKFDVAFYEQWDNEEPAYIWDPTHPIFNIPIDYQGLILEPSGSYIDDGDKVHVLNDAKSLAGFSTSESENNSGIVLGNGGQTLINSFMIDGLNSDFDDSTYKDAYELWLNEIAFMMRPTINSPPDLTYVEKTTGNNISWSPSSWYPHDYSVDINGTVANTSSWDGGTILFDADGFEPGIHLVTLTVFDGLELSATDTVLVNVTAKTDVFPFDLDPEFIIIVGAVVFGLLVIIFIFRKRKKK